MKYLLLFFSLTASFGQITYPVNVNADLFTFKLGTNVARNATWPRIDGMQLSGAPTNLIILKQFASTTPTYTNTSHKLADGIWVDNTNLQTATFTNSLLVLTVQESNQVQQTLQRATQRNNLSNAIVTLRAWSDQAEGTIVTGPNTIATLQTIVTRLGIFFDEFADLLEIQRINQ